jgi:hypothetical protein
VNRILATKIVRDPSLQDKPPRPTVLFNSGQSAPR